MSYWQWRNFTHMLWSRCRSYWPHGRYTRKLRDGTITQPECLRLIKRMKEKGIYG